MAGSSLLVLLDDIAAVLDDVALMSKVAAKKTAGVLGDDLAVNAEKVAGVDADRELPVVWAVARGSFRNKFILVPAALLLAAFVPWIIGPLLMLGGLYLCYEGFEKVWHSLFHHREELEERAETLQQLANPAIDPVAFERDKIRGAIRTDFILSAEIIVITLGIVADSELTTQIAVVAAIALGMTVVVYGLVAAIVKLDDAGLHLSARAGQNVWSDMQRTLGRGMLVFAPLLMKTLAIVGTAAMFLVGGGILTHGVGYLHHLGESLAGAVHDFVLLGPLLAAMVPALLAVLCGVLAGGLVLVLVAIPKKLFSGSP